ncbi:MAG: large-conductance mechanosensitive channel protein MscL [Ruminococcaceae bacterium]|nr:large-conductance mechanosensitive channel protein MscL [Oscillospiraceae bacterium]
MKKKATNFLKEFRDFAVKGNVIDMAVGVIIGGAFGKIVTSLVNDVIMPFFSVLLSDIPLASLSLTLKEGTEEVPSILFKYGNFLQTMVDFLLIAFFIFLFVRILNKFKKKTPPAPPAPPVTPEDILLLREIRDLLAKEQPAQEEAEEEKTEVTV